MDFCLQTTSGRGQVKDSCARLQNLAPGLLKFQQLKAPGARATWLVQSASGLKGDWIKGAAARDIKFRQIGRRFCQGACSVRNLVEDPFNVPGQLIEFFFQRPLRLAG